MVHAQLETTIMPSTCKVAASTQARIVSGNHAHQKGAQGSTYDNSADNAAFS